MESLIRRLISLAVGPLRSLVDGFRNSVLRMWHLLVNFFGGSRVAWTWLRQWYNNWTIAHWFGLLSVYDWARNLMFVRIPRLLSTLSRELTTWASRLINEVGTLARNLFREAIDFATRAINGLISELGKLARWATQWIARLVSDVGRLLRRVFDDWASPGKLAAWLVGAMFSALWKYFLTNVERVSESLWPYRQQIIIRSLSIVETILAKVL